MHLETTQICFYESDSVTLHSDMNKMRENGTKLTLKLPQYYIIYYYILLYI